MREIIEKYFRDGRITYYNPADIINNENYLTYRFNGDKVIIGVGSNEGEIELFVCDSPEKLEEKIKAIIY